MARDLRALVEVLPAPVATFRRLAHGSGWLVPWVALSLATVALTFLTLSITQRASVHLFSSVDDAEVVASVSRQLEQLRWVSLGLAPAHLLARLGFTAALFWALGAVGLGAVPFRTALVIAAHAAVPVTMGRALDLGVTWFEGPEFTPGMLPVLTSASSLAVLVPGLEHPAWVPAMLRHLTLFALWGAALWAVGLRHAAGVGRTRAVVMAALVWLVFLAGSTAGEVVSESLGRLAVPG